MKIIITSMKHIYKKCQNQNYLMTYYKQMENLNYKHLKYNVYQNKILS